MYGRETRHYRGNAELPVQKAEVPCAVFRKHAVPADIMRYELKLVKLPRMPRI